MRFPSGRLGAVVFLAAVACANSTSGLDFNATTNRPSADSQKNWDRPLANSHQVSSSDQAASELAFSPRDPRNLGASRAIFVTGNGTATASASEKATRVLAYVFDSPTYGRVVVTEEPLRGSPEDFLAAMQDLVTGNGKSGRSGSGQIAVIRGAKQALITTSEDGTRSDIRWIEDNIVFLVEGPMLSQRAVVDIANGV